ncbi:MAG TPA: nuclear transport factor 2 family protein [Gemmatimonadales bacterium]|jgi:ketosteroid isomerase-like protein|nr:nuclear transport factor 2 family protein [Gemmatimonadales bacterium]
MKRFVFVALAAAVGCGTPPSTNRTADSTALLAAYEQYRHAWLRGDTAAALSVISDSIKIYISGLPDIVGKDTTRKLFADEMGAYDMQLLNLRHQDIILSGDHAIVVGRYDEIELPKTKGPPVRNVGRYLTVWRKETGTWRIVRYMLNDLPKNAP